MGSILGLGRKRTRLHTPVFLHKESHGQRSPVGCSSWGRKELDKTEANQHTQTHRHTHTHTHRGNRVLAGVLTTSQASTPSLRAGSQVKLWVSAAEGVLLWSLLSISAEKNGNIYGIWGIRDLERLQEWEGGVVTEIVDTVTMARHCRFPAHWSLPEIRERLWGGREP